jgi:hypothetical protein
MGKLFAFRVDVSMHISYPSIYEANNIELDDELLKLLRGSVVNQGKWFSSNSTHHALSPTLRVFPVLLPFSVDRQRL